MENLFKGFKGFNHGEPEDKYGVQFEYSDLCHRLQLLKQQRELQFNGRSFKSFDKSIKKSPVSRESSQNKSGASLRSNSFIKNQNRCISSDFKKILKIYSPNSKQKIPTPDKVVYSVHFPSLIPRQRGIKRLSKGLRLKS